MLSVKSKDSQVTGSDLLFSKGISDLVLWYGPEHSIWEPQEHVNECPRFILLLSNGYQGKLSVLAVQDLKQRYLPQVLHKRDIGVLGCSTRVGLKLHLAPTSNCCATPSIWLLQHLSTIY